MKQFKHLIVTSSENGYGPDLPSLWELLTIKKNGDKVTFREECDGYYSETVSKDDAIAALEELIEWLKEPTDGGR